MWRLSSDDFKMPLSYFRGILLLATVFAVDAGAVDYCSSHTFSSSYGTSFMQFTKETVSNEFAVTGQFKALHCCGKGYRSIEWWVESSRICVAVSRRILPNKRGFHESISAVNAQSNELKRNWNGCGIHAHDLRVVLKRSLAPEFDELKWLNFRRNVFKMTPIGVSTRSSFQTREFSQFREFPFSEILRKQAPSNCNCSWLHYGVFREFYLP